MTGVFGFRDEAQARLAGAFEIDDLWVATDDGSIGRRGTAVELAREVGAGPQASVLACGPAPMLAAARAWAAEAGLSGYASLEAHMACGTGACHGCVVPTSRGYLRVCVEGPVFPFELLVDEPSAASAEGPPAGRDEGPPGRPGRGTAMSTTSDGRPDLSVRLAGVPLAHPVLNASGTFDVLETARRFGEQALTPFRLRGLCAQDGHPGAARRQPAAARDRDRRRHDQRRRPAEPGRRGLARRAAAARPAAGAGDRQCRRRPPGGLPRSPAARRGRAGRRRAPDTRTSWATS